MKTTDCIFCKIANKELAADIVHEDVEAIAFLDSRPLFPGHLLLIPRRHYATLPDLPSELAGSLMRKAQWLVQAVEAALQAEGTFVAINNKVSQSVPHLHIHLVPRRKGDGLRGFFWPRHKYQDDATREAVRTGIMQEIERLSLQPPA